jgi:putative iron-regulated protein
MQIVFEMNILMKVFPPILILLAGLFCLPRAAAADSDPPSVEQVKAAFIAHYADLLEAEYADSLELTRQTQTAIETFLQRPSAENLAVARQAWTDCREPYMQSEISRFYDGPIDSIEGYINAWPIDENYLDYTVAAPDAGTINQIAVFPHITLDVIVGANEREGEKTVSTGFHAIEFLLWGQDFYADSPGRRPYTDYVDGPAGPGLHAARRREYLHLLAGLLVQHLQIVTGQWAPNQPGNYRARFLALAPDVALTKIFNGVGNLSGSELTGERILVPYTTKSQENEHDCFSDTTHLDLVRNELGVQNICLGCYKRANGKLIQGTGLIALLEKVDPKLAARLQHQLETAMAALKAIPPPFDQAILGDDSAPGRVAIKKSLGALRVQTASIARAAAVLHIQLNLK